jgi:hypothetical protein
MLGQGGRNDARSHEYLNEEPEKATRPFKDPLVLTETPTRGFQCALRRLPSNGAHAICDGNFWTILRWIASAKSTLAFLGDDA